LSILNSYTFHINLYDLAFLGAIFIGLTFAGLLWFTKTVNRGANRFLALALVTMILWMVRVLAIDLKLETYLPGWHRVPTQFLLALGPLIYFYVLKITTPKFRFRWKDLLHFSPLLLEQAVQVLSVKQGAGTGVPAYATHTFQQVNPVLQLLTFISIITYLWLCDKRIQSFYHGLQPILMDRPLVEFRWLRRLLGATALLWLLWLVCVVVNYIGYRNQLGIQVYYPFYIFFVVIIIWTAAAAFLKPQAAVTVQTNATARQPIPAELRAKGALVKRAMETNLYYQEPELSLSSLAEKLKMPPHELSKIINTVFKKSFNDLVNEYRVKDVVAKMQDPAYDNMTLLGIAYEAGFNSRTTFHRIFKQMTGKSPADYKTEGKKEIPSYNLEHRLRAAAIISGHQTHRGLDVKLNRNYMFRNYVKTAFRGIWKHKLFTLINITGLSIGISAALVIYIIVQYDFTFDKFHKDGDRIHRVVTNFLYSGAPGYNAGVSGPLTVTDRSQFTGLQAIGTIYRLSKPNVQVPNNGATPTIFKSQDNVTLADSGYFSVFQYHWLAGTPQSALKEPFRVVLASEQAHKYFPGLSYDQMIGRTVIYDTIKTTVTGIVETIKKNTDFTFHDFISYPTALANSNLKAGLRLQNWIGTSPDIQLYVKLAPGYSAATIQRQFNDILKKNAQMRPGTAKELILQPLADIHFNTNYGIFANARVADKTTLYQLEGIALFLLLLGCINFINLTTAQSAQRAKEIGIRKTLGSSRKQLILQFLTETFLIVLSAVIISAATAPLVLKAFSAFIPAGVSVNFINQPGIVVFLLILTVTVTLLSGFYPALVLSGYKPISVLKKQVQVSSGQTRNVWLRKSLTVTQFVIAQFFIMATVLVSKQIYYALHKDLGFKKDAIVIINSPTKNRRPDLDHVMLNRLKTIPQIETVSQGFDAPISDYPQSTEGAYIDGKRQIKFDNLGMKLCDENYLEVYHIKLLAGRNIRPGDTSANVFVINNTLAKLIGCDEPQKAIGKTIDNFNGDTKMQIIGVVADFHQESSHTPVIPLVMFTSREAGYKGNFHIALKPETNNGNNWHAAIAGMEKVWKDIYPDDDFAYHFFDENIARLYTNEQNLAALLNWATGLCVFISCLGLLGLAIYTSNQRTKEIGVRKVLGASVTQIVVLLSTETVWLIILAFIIVTPIAWWAMHNWMQGFADRTAISWWIFVLSGIGMLLVAMLTAGFQTISAALANPVKSLRSE